MKIPRWLPPAVFAAATLVLFAGFIFSSEMMYGTDTNALGYMARAFYADALQTEGFPLWNPYILGGTPFLEALSGGDSLYPLSAPLLLFMDTYRALGWKLVLHVFLAGVFMYGWIRTLGLSKPAALLAGLAFTMAPYMVSLVFNGQDGKIFVTALTPLAFMAMERALNRRKLHDYALLSLVIGVVILTTHFQLAYFLFGAMGAYAIFRAIREFMVAARDESTSEEESIAARQRAFGGFGAFLVAALLGAGIAAIQLLPAFDYVGEHSRRTSTTVQAQSPEYAEAYSSSWSLHPEEVVALAVPEFVGASPLQDEWGDGTYWGRNGFKSNSEYLGLMVILLASLSFFSRKMGPRRWFFVGLGAVALLFGLGTHTPVWKLFYSLVPGIGLFRAPSLAIFLVGFSVTTLMAFGVDRLLELASDRHTPAEEWKWPQWVALGSVGVGLLFFLMVFSGGLFSVWTASIFPDIGTQQYQSLELARPHIARGAAIALAMTFVFAGVVWGLATRKLPALAAVVVLGTATAADLYRIDKSFILTFPFEEIGEPRWLINRLLENVDEEYPSRVLSLNRDGQDVEPGQFGVELAGGHHPNDLQRYRELIGMEGSGLPQNLIWSDRLYDILNIGFVLWPAQRYRPLDDFTDEELDPRLIPLRDKLERLSGTQNARGEVFEILYRVETLPRARLVNRVDVVPEDQTVQHILTGDFDPATEVVLNEPPFIQMTGEPFRSGLEWVERGNNRQVMNVGSDEPALLVVADNWYPAWKATVNGEPVEVLRANHTQRAVPVPAGASEVVFWYDPSGLMGSLWMSVASLLLVTGVGGVSWFRERKATAGPGGEAPGPETEEVE